jgi:hypothetical protein
MGGGGGGGGQGGTANTGTFAPPTSGQMNALSSGSGPVNSNYSGANNMTDLGGLFDSSF